MSQNITIRIREISQSQQIDLTEYLELIGCDFAVSSVEKVSA